MPDAGLSDLTPDELTTLHAAAVCGSSFEPRQLRAMVPAPSSEPRALLRLLERCVAAGVLVRLSDRADRYAFASDERWRAVLAVIDVETRAALHAAAAQALVALYPDPDARQQGDIATHCWEAGESVPGPVAWRHAVAAADAHARECLWEIAVQHGEHAVALVDRLSGLLAAGDVARERYRCWLSLASTRQRAGDFDAARAAYERAVTAARSLGRAGTPEAAACLAEAALGLGSVRAVVQMGIIDEPLVAVLEEALAALGDERPDLRARLMGRLAEERYFASKQELSGPYRDETSRAAVVLARTTRDPRTLAAALSSRRLAVWAPDNRAERLEMSAEILHLIDQIHEPDLEALALILWVHDQLEGGERSGVDNTITRLERLAAQQRRPLFDWQAHTLRVMQALLDGRLADADALLEAASAIGMRGSPNDALVIGVAQRYFLRREQGRLAELAEEVGLIARSFSTLPVATAAACHLYACSGQTEEARRIFEPFARQHFADHIIPWDQNWPLTMALLGEAAIALEDHRRAAELFDVLMPLRGLIVLVPFAAAVVAPVSEVLAGLAGFLDRREDAEELAAEAFEAAVRLRARPIAERLNAREVRPPEGVPALAQVERRAQSPETGSAPPASGVPALAAGSNAMRWTPLFCEIWWRGASYMVSSRLVGVRYIALAFRHGEIRTEDAYQRCRRIEPPPDDRWLHFQAVDTDAERRALAELREEMEALEAEGRPTDVHRAWKEKLEDRLLERSKRGRSRTDRAVAEALRRLYEELDQNGGSELADYLRATVRVTSGLLRYRPPQPTRWEIEMPAEA